MRAPIVWLLAGLLAGSGAAWGFGEVLDDGSQAVVEAEPTLVEAVEDELSRSQIFTGTLTVGNSTEITTSAAGTVTWKEDSQVIEVGVGTTVAEVDLVPVVAIEGSVPMFRGLGQGDRGSDVLQLQAFLVAEGYLDGEPDGVYGASTTAAVKRWKRDAGERKPSGRLEPGRLLALEALPAEARYADAVQVGAALAGGDPLLTIPAGDATLVVQIPSTRVGDFEAGTLAMVQVEEAEDVLAAVSGLVTLEGVGVGVGVEVRPTSGRFCDVLACVGLTAGGSLPVPVEFETLAPTRGVVVPVSALRTQPDESMAVLTGSGERIAVEVVATDRGLAVVDGLEAGVSVVVG